MSLVLLLAATLALVLLPLVPALFEWRRPSDAAPLVIDPGHALDPSGFARSFADRLRQSVERGESHLGRSELVGIDATAACGHWPLSPAEVAAACSHRVWHVDGDALLPPGHSFLAEVAASGDLETAPGGVHRALLGGRRLVLADCGVVLRWAHAEVVEVSRGCWLAGRVSAARRLAIDGGVRFTLLHAPVVQFGERSGGIAAAPHAATAPPQAPLQGLVWNEASNRGVCDAPLSVPAGSVWQGDVVCRSVLRLGPACHAQGSLKAHGAMGLDARCRVDGSIVAQGLVRLQRGCVVLGSVVSETAVVIGPDCVIGAPGRPATVTAPRISVAAGTVVHGTVWATEEGMVEGMEECPAPVVVRPDTARRLHFFMVPAEARA